MGGCQSLRPARWGARAATTWSSGSVRVRVHVRAHWRGASGGGRAAGPHNGVAWCAFLEWGVNQRDFFVRWRSGRPCIEQPPKQVGGQGAGGHRARRVCLCCVSQAAIRAIEEVLGQPGGIDTLDVRVHSQYVANSLQQLPVWKQNGWKQNTGGAVSHQDMWRELDRLLVRASFAVTFTYVPRWVRTAAQDELASKALLVRLPQQVLCCAVLCCAVLCCIVPYRMVTCRTKS